MPRTPALVLGACLVLGGPGVPPSRATPQDRAPRLENDSYVEAEPEAARLLAGARDAAATGRAADAAAAYAHLIERAEAVGRAWVVAVRSPREEEGDPEGGRYFGVHEAVRSDLAAGSPDVRAIYLARAGPPAARALAASGRDSSALRAVARRFPGTPEAVEALARLGDAHFEEGRPGRALGCYVRAAAHLGLGEPVPALLAARAAGAAAASGDPPVGRLAPAPTEGPAEAPAPRDASEPWSGLAAADATWAAPAPAEDCTPRRVGHRLPHFEGRRSPAATGDRVVLQGTTEVVAYALAPDPTEPAAIREAWRYRDPAAEEQKALAEKSNSEARSRIESWVRRMPSLPRKPLHSTVHAPALADGRVFALLGGTAPIATLFRQPLLVWQARR
ncbi:MAG: hypothetical protein L0216_20625, partial [Planctomycetales bacterium]|nr:hypothetical protein [Planctomycetales bacterium]